MVTLDYKVPIVFDGELVVMHPSLEIVSSLFKQDTQLHIPWQSANWQCSNCTFYITHFNFTTAQIVIDCMLKYALLWHKWCLENVEICGEIPCRIL